MGSQRVGHDWVNWTELNWTVARQAALSVAFSRQEYWSELSFPSPVDLIDQGGRIQSKASCPEQCDSLGQRSRREREGVDHWWKVIALSSLGMSTMIINDGRHSHLEVNTSEWTVQAQFSLSTLDLWNTALMRYHHCLCCDLSHSFSFQCCCWKVRCLWRLILDMQIVFSFWNLLEYSYICCFEILR